MYRSSQVHVLSAPLRLKKNHSFTTLMALKRYAQTTIGYARVLQLTPEAIKRLAQKKIGSEVRFELSGKR